MAEKSKVDLAEQRLEAIAELKDDVLLAISNVSLKRYENGVDAYFDACARALDIPDPEGSYYDSPRFHLDCRRPFVNILAEYCMRKRQGKEIVDRVLIGYLDSTSPRQRKEEGEEGGDDPDVKDSLEQKYCEQEEARWFLDALIVRMGRRRARKLFVHHKHQLGTLTGFVDFDHYVMLRDLGRGLRQYGKNGMASVVPLRR